MLCNFLGRDFDEVFEVFEGLESPFERLESAFEQLPSVIAFSLSLVMQSSPDQDFYEAKLQAP